MWDKWSKTCPEKFDPAGQDKAWASFGRDYDGERVTVATIYHLAKEHGWIGPSGPPAATYDTAARQACPIIRVAGGGLAREADEAEQALIGSGLPAGKTEEETEKRLGALLRDGMSVVSIDNVSGELGGDALAQMTERPLVRMRILGKSEAPEFACKAAIFATGNNLVLVGDMVRRAVICTLDARVERPELREFKFDPIDRVLQDRGPYVAGCLTISRAYKTAGAPKVCRTLGKLWRVVRLRAESDHPVSS